MNNKYKTCYYNGHRYYIDLETGRKVPSVTSITGLISPFKNTKIGPAALTGSLLHYHLEKHFCEELNKEPPEAPRDMIWVPGVMEKISSGLKMFRDLDLKYDQILGAEETIFNHEFGYAGKVDRICKLDNNIIIDEFKSGNFYPYYELQGAAYAKALGSEMVRFIQLDLNPERNLGQIGKVIYMDKDQIEKSFDQFLELLERFNNEC